MPQHKQDITESLQKIRDSKEFVYTSRDETPGWLAQMWENLNNFLADLKKSIIDWLKDLFPDTAINTPVQFEYAIEIITWVLAGVVVVVLLIILFKLLNKFKKQEKVEIKSIINLQNGVIDSSSWLDLAKNHSTQRKYREACRAVYMAMILYLDEKEIIKYDKAKTNMEYLQTVRGKEDIYNPLKKIINVFEYLWYGKHKGNENDYKSCIADYEKVTNE